MLANEVQRRKRLRATRCVPPPKVYRERNEKRYPAAQSYSQGPACRRDCVRTLRAPEERKNDCS